MIGVFIVLLALLWWIPTGFQKQIYVNSEGVKAKVVEVNNKGLFHGNDSTRGPTLHN